MLFSVCVKRAENTLQQNIISSLLLYSLYEEYLSQFTLFCSPHLQNEL